MAPETIQQLATTFGVPGAVLLYMWLNRRREEPAESPVKELVEKLDGINARLIRVETILEERK